jgi:lipopolysaccharide assembly outer membrane protein LptD (OstA)
MTKSLWPKLTALTAVVAAVAGLALTTSAQDPKTAKEPSYKYVELLNADDSLLKFGNEKIHIYKGNVKIRQGDTMLFADSVEYNENDKIQTAVATGNFKVTDPQNDITGTKGITYFLEKRAVVEGNVKILAKPKQGQVKDPNSAKAKWKDPLTITCDNLEYLYKKKIATLTGHLNVVQKGRIITADSAVYQVKDELVTLKGNVSGKDEKGQTFSTPEDVVVSLKDGQEWIEMKHATGTFRVEVDDEEEPAKADAQQPAKEEPKTP